MPPNKTRLRRGMRRSLGGAAGYKGAPGSRLQQDKGSDIHPSTVLVRRRSPPRQQPHKALTREILASTLTPCCHVALPPCFTVCPPPPHTHSPILPSAGCFTVTDFDPLGQRFMADLMSAHGFCLLTDFGDVEGDKMGEQLSPDLLHDFDLSAGGSVWLNVCDFTTTTLLTVLSMLHFKAAHPPCQCTVFTL